MTEPAPSGLRPGAVIRIHGISSAPHLNGQVAVCQQWDASKERWQVALPSGEVKSLKPDRLQAVDLPPGGPAQSAPPKPPVNLQAGAVVRLHSLQSLPQLNGQVAVCEKYDAERDLWEVRLQNGELKAINHSKLEKAEFSAAQARQFGQSWADPVPPRAGPPPGPPTASPWASPASPWQTRPEHHPVHGMPPPVSPWGTGGGVWGSHTPAPPGVWGAGPPAASSPWGAPPPLHAHHPWGGAGGVFGTPLPPPRPAFVPPPARPPPPPAPAGSEFPHHAAGPGAAVPNVMPHTGFSRGPVEANDVRDNRAHAGHRQAYGFEAQAEQEIRRGLSASRSRSARRRTRSPQPRRRRDEKHKKLSRSASPAVPRQQRRSRPVERSRSRECMRNAAPVTPPLESKASKLKPVAKSALRQKPVAKSSLPSKRFAASGSDTQSQGSAGAEAATAASRPPAPAAEPRETHGRHRLPRPPAPPSRKAQAEAVPSLENLEDLSVAEMKARVKDIFERKNPAKVEQLDALFTKYAGSELVVYKQVCKKYDEPLVRPMFTTNDAVPRDVHGSASATRASEDAADSQRGTWDGLEASHSKQRTPSKPLPSPIGAPWRSAGVWGDSNNTHNEQEQEKPRRRAPTPSAASVQAFRGVWDQPDDLHDDPSTPGRVATTPSASSKPSRRQSIWDESDQSMNAQGRSAPSSSAASGQASCGGDSWGEETAGASADHEDPSPVLLPSAKQASRPTARPSASSTARPSAARPSSRVPLSLPRPTSRQAAVSTSSSAAPADEYEEEEPVEEEEVPEEEQSRSEAPVLLPTAKCRSKPPQEHRQSSDQDDSWGEDDGWHDDAASATAHEPGVQGDGSDIEFSPLSEEEEDKAAAANGEWTKEEWAAWEEDQKKWYSSPKREKSWMEEVDQLREESVEEAKEDGEKTDNVESPRKEWPVGDVAPWRVKKSAEKSSQELCPAGHQLKEFELKNEDCACDRCGKDIAKGAKLYGCRLCNFDVCLKCLENPQVEQPGAATSPSKRMGENGNFGQKGQTKGLAKGKGQVVVKCPAGHTLKHHRAQNEHECDKCEKTLKRGIALYSCRRCNYDLCGKCMAMEISTQFKKCLPKYSQAAAKGKGKKHQKGGQDDEPEQAAKWNEGYETMPEKLAGDKWEEPREKVGYKIVKDMAPDGLTWTYPLEDESRRSFAGYLAGALSDEECTSFFEKIRDGTDWKRPESKQGWLLPRKTAWMVSKGCTCHYQYGSVQVAPEEYPPWMTELMQATMPGCGLSEPSSWPDSCNLNLYEDGGMSVGWHADDEKLFQGKFCDIKIISLSLGAARKFELRKNWPEDNEEPVTQFLLGNGDLVTMEGMTQKHFQHRVPREEGIKEPRINLTWRWILKHTVHCPASRHRAYSKDSKDGE